MDRDKVIKGMECCIDYAQRVKDLINGVPCDGCPYVALKPIAVGQGDCIDSLFKDALALLKAQEPRVMTAADFDNNPNTDSQGFLPAWIEYRRDDEWGEYWADDDDEWTSVRADNFEGYGYRCWTSRPTKAEREAVKWE